MAIEFDCPYCTATIRVPDAWGGREGRCPKCDTRLLIPTVLRPGPTATSSPAAPATGTNGEATEEFLVKPVPQPGTSGRRRAIRRRPSRALVIGLPVLCFLILLGIIGYHLISSLPELSGELKTRRLAEKTLPAVTVSWAETGLSEEDRSLLQETLRTHPETLASQILTCRLIGTAEGISVQMTASEGSAWFAVDTTSSKPLALWVRKERAAINARRLKIHQEALVAYCRDKLAQIRRENVVIDALAVRDEFAFNACGGPLSFVCEAIAGNVLVPCAQESTDGGVLYFCLPASTQVFEIRGKTLNEAAPLFAGQYTAVVVPGTDPPASAEPSTDAGTANETTAEKSDAEKSTEEMSDDLSSSAESQTDSPAEDAAGKMIPAEAADSTMKSSPKNP